VLPIAAREIFYQLNCAPNERLADAAWSGLPDEHRLGKAKQLFPRIETV
jgi:hypothetical protein